MLDGRKHVSSSNAFEKTPLSAKRRRSKLIAMASGICAVVIWAATPGLIKIGIADSPVISVLALRYLVSTVLFIPFFKYLRRWVSAVPIQTWLRLILFAILTVYTQSVALTGLPASWYTVFFATSPILTLLVLRSKWNRHLVLSIALCLIGVALFSISGESAPQPSWDSILLLCLSLAAWIGMTYTMVRMHQYVSDLGCTVIINLSIAGFMILAFLCSQPPEIQLSLSQSIAVLSMAILFPAAVFLFSYSIRIVPVFGICSQYLEITIGLVISVIFLGEEFNFVQIIGASIVVIALVVLTHSSNEQ